MINQGDIAIVGMSCRFPGARDLNEYWQLLTQQQQAVRPIPANRLALWPIDSAIAQAAADLAGLQGGYIEDIEQFDPRFFDISPGEAQTMDPQQRLLLQTSWHALCDAGLNPQALRGSNTGVFVGISAYEYASLVSGQGEAKAGTGNAHAIAANRLSYFYGFTGPSLAVDTACSSSLVALHLAIQAIRQGQCQAALVCGVQANLSPMTTLGFQRAGFMSPSYRCHSFDERADGYVRGEGVGCLYLTVVPAAAAHPYRPYARLLGSAVNSDGRSNGLTAPNPKAQEAVIRAALQDAGVGAGQISYVEAHGTGTKLGDPIEFKALNKIFSGRGGGKVEIGSVKTNLGHLEAAAGIASVIKVALALYHRTIPASLHFQTPNAFLQYDKAALRVVTATKAWPDGDTAIAGISSFGFGGTNSHVVLGAAPALLPVASAAPPATTGLWLPLSAASGTALQALAQAHVRQLSQLNHQQVQAYCAKAWRQESFFTYKAAVAAQDVAGLIGALQQDLPVTASPSAPVPAFVFTGQGALYRGVGQALYQQSPVFRRRLDQCQQWLAEHHQMDLQAFLWDEDAAALSDTYFAQPALLSLQLALADVWQANGVQPQAVLGHSVGEYAAACVAGVLSAEQALLLISRRAALMARLPDNGAMAVVFAGVAQVRAWLADYPSLNIAAVNNHSNTVVSGDKSGLDALLAVLSARQIRCQRLAVSHAFHSAMMQATADEFLQIAETLDYGQPRLPVYSTLEGRRISTEMSQGSYWARHIVEPVYFADAVLAAHDDGISHWLELGPASTLLAMLRPLLDAAPAQCLPSLGHGAAGSDIWQQSAQALYLAGVRLQPEMYKDVCLDPALSLALYPFDRQPYWFEPARRQRLLPQVASPDAGAMLPDWQVRWRALPANARQRFATGTTTWFYQQAPDSDARAATELLPDSAIQRLPLPADQPLTLPGATVAGQPWQLVLELDCSAAVDPAGFYDEVRRHLVLLQPLSRLTTTGLSRVVIIRRVPAGLTEPLAVAVSRVMCAVLSAERPDLALIQLDCSPDTALATLAEFVGCRFDEDQLRLTANGLECRYLTAAHDGAALPAMPVLRADRSYLIVGANGEIGFAQAASLVELGAKQLILLSRSAQFSAEQQQQLGQWRALGVEVLTGQLDLSRPDVGAQLDSIVRCAQPVDGIIHAAGVLADEAISDVAWPTVLTVCSAKVEGTWQLHQWSLSRSPAFFVLNSSVSSVFAPPHQCSYAAAAAYMDSLYLYRRTLGLPATCFNWGPLAGSAMARGAQSNIAQSFVGQHDLAQLQHFFQQHVGGMGRHIGCVLDAERLAIRAGLRPDVSLYQQWRRAVPAVGSSGWLDELTSLAGELRHSHLAAKIEGCVRQVLGIRDGQALAWLTPLNEHGLDSVLALTLRNKLAAEVKQPLPSNLLFDQPSITALASYLLKLLQLEPVAGEPQQKSQGIQPEPVAIIGLDCRLPGAIDGPGQFWQLLQTGQDAVSELTDQRWDMQQYYSPTPAAGKMTSKWGGLIGDIRLFANEFFNISYAEAINIDPQQRVVLESAWRTLEHAGVNPDRLKQRAVGVYLGVGPNDYLRTKQLAPETLNAYMGTGNSLSVIAGRVSYFFGWQGPAMSIDTACSSSLVAIHQACQSLRAGECEMALAGGINLLLSADTNVVLSQAGMLAPDGRCKTFDQRANGYVRSEGCGLLLLKPLSQARADGDRILAVIRGSAVNQDGCSQGLTAPNGDAQQQVIRQALQQAAVLPQDVSYVEAHGTGTALGDPIEINALNQVYCEGVARRQPLWVGALKSNIGHTEAAAGVAGVIKTVLSLQHQQIPPTLHLQQRNPHLAADAVRMEFPTELQPWPVHDGPALAAVSAFGFSGTNAHLILSAYQAEPVSVSAADGPALLALSAKTAAELQACARSYLGWLEQPQRVDWRAICQAHNRQRPLFAYRRTMIAHSKAELRQQLQRLSSGPSADWTACHGEPLCSVLLPADLPSASAQFPQAVLRQLDTLTAELADASLPAGMTAVQRTGFLAQAALLRYLQQAGVRISMLEVPRSQLPLALWFAGAIDLAGALALSVGDYQRVQFPLAPPQRLIAEQGQLYCPGQLCSDAFWRTELSLRPAAGDRAPAVDLQLDLHPLWPAFAVPGSAGVESQNTANDAEAMLLTLLAQWLALGGNLDWQEVYGTPRSGVLPLPRYPFTQRDCWLAGQILSGPAAVRKTGLHPLLGERLPLPFAEEIRFNNTLCEQQLRYLADHQLFGHVVVPGAFYLSAALCAGQSLAGASACSLQGVEFLRPLVIRTGQSVAFQTLLRKSGEHSYQCQFFSADSPDSDDWTVHARCELSVRSALAGPVNRAATLREQPVSTHIPSQLAADDFYQAFARRGYQLAGQFRLLGQGYRGDDYSIRELVQQDKLLSDAQHPLYPGLIDACFQTLASLVAERPDGLAQGQIYIPLTVGQMAFHRQPLAGSALYCGVRQLSPASMPGVNRRFSADIMLWDSAGVVASFNELVVTAASEEVFRQDVAGQSCAYQLDWQVLPANVAEPTAKPGPLLILSNSASANNKDAHFMQTTDPAHIVASVRQLALTQQPVTVLCLWAAEQQMASSEPVPVQLLSQLTSLAQALEQQASGMARLILVTRDAVSRQASPAQASVWSLGRTMQVELSGVTVATLDLAQAAVPDGAALQALIAASGTARQLRLAGTELQFPRLSRQAAGSGQLYAYRPDHCYLITGGSGALARLLTNHLLAQGVTDIVLVSRSGRLPELSPLPAGCRVTAYQADLTDDMAVSTLMQRLQSGHQPLAGVFHAAGVLHDKPLFRMTTDDYQRVAQAKVSSLLLLERALFELKPEFILCFSSAAALFGAPGQANYAAANAYLSAWATQPAVAGIRRLSISWGPWDDGDGMASQQAAQQTYQQRGIRLLQPQVGLQWLDQVLQQTANNLLIADIDWTAFGRTLPSGARWSMFAELVPRGQVADSDAAQQLARAILQAAPAQQSALLAAWLTQWLSDKLMARQIDPQQSFLLLGVDSLVALQLRSDIKRLFQIELKIEQVLGDSINSVNALTQHLLERLAAPVSQDPSGQTEQLTFVRAPSKIMKI